MTRENKLALVIGFGLILFVGILISDHFSTADRQHSSQLGRGEGARTVALEDEPILLQTTDERMAARRGLNGEIAAHADTIPVDPGRPQSVIRIDDGPEILRAPDIITDRPTDPTSPARVEPQQRDALITVEVVNHDVKAGETLSTICQQYYGTASLVDALARFNDLDNPDHVRLGRTLRVPRNPADLTLGSGQRSTPSNAGDSTSGRAARTYTVANGDTLSKIAARVLGSAGRWRELYEMNRDVIDDPDSVPVGTTIRLPTSTG